MRVSKADIFSVTILDGFCDATDLVNGGDWGRGDSLEGAGAEGMDKGVEKRVDSGARKGRDTDERF